MWSDEITLIKETFKKDEVGNQMIDETIENVVLCDVKSTRQSEFYQAAQSNFRPEKIFIVHTYEYNNHQKVEFENVTYNIIRTYEKNYEELELICEKKAGE